MQVPPAFSALKVDGERAYAMARAGEDVELAARPLFVESLTLIDRPDPDHVQLEMVCGKGGYVRSIARDLDEYPLPIAPFGGPSPIRTLKGAVTWRAWRVPADGRSVASVLQAYRETLAEQGFQTLWDCKGDDCGGFDFRFDAALLPPPAMAMDVQDFAQLSAGRTGPASFASVLVSRVGDSLFSLVHIRSSRAQSRDEIKQSYLDFARYKLLA